MSPPIKLRALATRVLELAPPDVTPSWPTASRDVAGVMLARAVLELQAELNSQPPPPPPDLPLLEGPCPFGTPYRGVPGPPMPDHWSFPGTQIPRAWFLRCDPAKCAVCEPYRSEAPSKRQRGHHAYELGLGALRVLRDPQCRHDPLECRHEPMEKPRLLLAAASEEE